MKAIERLGDDRVRAVISISSKPRHNFFCKQLEMSIS